MSQDINTDGLREDLFGSYRVTPGVADELFDAKGNMRPVWARFVHRFQHLSTYEIRTRFERGDQYLRDAGVFFRQYSTAPLQERAWPLSHLPVILHETEWTTICAGLSQRADLLEQVMADLYGAGQLVSGNHLPAELIAGSHHWLRPMVGVTPRGGHYLHYLAFEIGRAPDGRWFVLGDRTQAPSGAGFALENRMATGRIFPERFPRAHMHKLSNFLNAFREQIESLAQGAGGSPAQPALLTPGPSNEAYYEHTYIARYLGIPLLEGEDLLVEGGRAMVRTIDGPKPLGALWRRIDASFADPLELDAQSHIGTPGLMEAVRQGNLSMVNALGSGILEMRAMMAFLPRISEVLTGAPLALPNIATWWCGGAPQRDYVRKNADRMMIGSAFAVDLPFDLDATTALGGEFRDGAQRPIADWLEEEGASLVGQEAVTLSTTPAWEEGAQGDHLVARPMTVRIFATRTAQGWQFMPGGYARIGRSPDATALGMQRGGSVADVWVVSDKPLDQKSEPKRPHRRFRRPEDSLLPARAADNLYWMGRYIERSEDALRLFRAYHLRLATTDNPADPRLRQLNQYLKGYGHNLTQAVPDSLIERLEAARGCAAKVRDRFSTDGWNALNDLLSTSQRMSRSAVPGDDAARAMSVLLRKMTGFSGLVHENMYRFSGWRFLSFGRALERADTLASILSYFAGPGAPQGSLDLSVELADSVITHQRRYRVETNRDTVMDLLALDVNNPRALAFLIHRMHELARALPNAERHGRPSQLVRHLLKMETECTICMPEDITPEWMTRVRHNIIAVSDDLTAAYLR
ncbi:hypothetical protein BFP70_02665 [Thioclava sp. SK-1]|uniref:circularly permuted type 2 ATP-grasp protein n=1 Tax=Thioclava sp. SK-1 TaxID=1889770 RepID=UPI000825C473|nr:circularly permuted type 2 ATP-grasp protein [Thioclava sp. SK-1]OCX67086.1 hypothetical protein BFP70_02665 [Thioclava sp. SK-1]